VASFEMTCDGVFGGPCPVCGGSGELLAQSATYGDYRTLRHTDAAGREQVCTLPEVEGMVRTAGGRWWYVPAGVPTSEEQLRAVIADLVERARAEADAGAPANMVAFYLKVQARHSLAGHAGHPDKCADCYAVCLG